jgi:Flp pilus assembly protein CpaB
VLVAAYLTNYKHHVQSGEQKVDVYVATKPIPAGTPAADLVNSNLIHKTTVLQRSMVPGVIDDPKKLANLYVTRAIFTNEQVTLDSFGTAAQRGTQGSLAGTDRAIDVTATPQQLLAGTVRDGDHVDVVASWGIGQNGDVKVSRTVLRDILVIKAPETGTKANITSGGTGNTAQAQLKLSDSQARQLFWLMENGEWALTLRSPVQASNGKDAYDDGGTLLLPALTASERAAVMAYERSVLAKMGSGQ